MKKQAAIIAVCAALLICVAAAGCTSSSSPNASATAHSPSKVVTTSPTVKPTPTVTPLPKASASVATTGLTVLFFEKPGCPYCAAAESSASFAQLQSKVTVQWIVSTTSPLTAQYGVTTVPTFILLKNGQEVGSPTADPSVILAQISGG